MKITIAIGLLLAVIRVWMGLNIEPDPVTWAQVYKDVAHLFIGGLAVAWWCKRRAWQWYLFWYLCVVEVAVAVYSRVGC